MKILYKLILPAVAVSGLLVACSDPSSSETDTSIEGMDVLKGDAPVAVEETNEIVAKDQSGETIDVQGANGHSHDSGDTVRAAEAHIHGAAELSVVLENDLLIVELESPHYNILGFEHAPETEAQKAAVKSAETQLMLGEALFSFNASAQCQYQANNDAITLFKTMSDGDSHDHHGEDHDKDHEHANEHDHSHDDHAHDADHNHTHEDSDDKDHSHGDHHDHAHKDVVLQYTFKCEDSSQLGMMTVGLFDAFENMSDLDVVYLGPSTQKQVSLNRNQTKMDLTP
jgi:hypothetical protein